MPAVHLPDGPLLQHARHRMQVLAEISLVAAAKHQRMVKQEAVAIITVTKKKAHQKKWLSASVRTRYHRTRTLKRLHQFKSVGS
jgi:hypothetical protein